MATHKPATKLCKYCQMEIPSRAKVCPNCRRKLKGGALKWISLAVIAVIVIAAIAGGGDEKEKAPSEPVENVPVQAEQEVSKPEEKPTEDAAPADAQTVYRVGDALQDGGLKIVYMSSGEYVSDNDFMQPTEGNKYIFVQLAFENTADKDDEYVSIYEFECYADGYNVSMYYGEEDTLSATLSSGRATSGYLYFEVPENASEIEVEYETNLFTEEKVTFIYEGEKTSGYVVPANSGETAGALAVGEVLETDSLAIQYLACYRDSGGSDWFAPREGHYYLTCEFEFENRGSSDETVSSLSFDCYADGLSCTGAYFREDNLSATLSAGRKAKGTVTFEVPEGAQTVEVELLDNIWTSERIVFAAKAQ